MGTRTGGPVLDLLEHRIVTGSVACSDFDDRLLGINFKLVSDLGNLGIKVHAGTNTVIEITKGGVPLKSYFISGDGIMTASPSEGD